MKTSTGFLLASLALTLAVGCSSSEGGATGGGSSEGGGNAGGGNQGGNNEGAGDQGGGAPCEGDACECGEPPLDCIGGDYVEDENGCTICDYWECAANVCPEGSPSSECVGDGVVICDRGEGDCGALDTANPDIAPCADGYICRDSGWTCSCPSVAPAEGTLCNDVGQTCVVPSDLDCGPATITIECTGDGWTREQLDGGAGGGGGGTDCG